MTELNSCIVCQKFTTNLDDYDVCSKCIHRYPNSIGFRRIGSYIVPIRKKKIVRRETWNGLVAKIRLFYLANPDKFIKQFNKDETNKQKEEEKKRCTKIGWIYLLRSDNGFYKIGYSKDVKARIGGLMKEFPVEIRMVHKIRTAHMRMAEKYLHINYQEYRLQGEWFRLSQKHVDRIISMDQEELDSLAGIVIRKDE